jgi:hypothetical protein
MIENHLLACAKQVPSLNYNERPNDKVSLVVIHNISLPPKQFGGDCVEQRLVVLCLGPFVEKDGLEFDFHKKSVQPDLKINSTHGETQQSSSTSISNCQENSEVVKAIHTEQLQYETENIPTYDVCQVVNISTMIFYCLLPVTEEMMY